MKELRDKLQRVVSVGYADSGFPILKQEHLGLKVVGYIGTNELEHALGELRSVPPSGSLAPLSLGKPGEGTRAPNRIGSSLYKTFL